MDAQTVRQKTCQRCEDAGAEVLVTERSTDAYGQSVLEIVSYACTDCAEELVKDGYRETPIADVDPDVVELEVQRSEGAYFVIKRREQATEAWLKTAEENSVEDVEARR